MPLNTLEDLFVEELKDVYSAETQIVRALPKMSRAATSETLRTAFEEHLEQTKGHVKRLEQIFDKLGQDPKGKACKGMRGLLEEGDEFMGEKPGEQVMDAGLISAAQRVEHYEMAAYGTCKAFAEQLGLKEYAKLLDQTLKEEELTDKKLTEIAEHQANDRAKAR